MNTERRLPKLILAFCLLAAFGLSSRLHAQGGPTVTIDRVDATDFPNIVVDLTVADSFGVPLPGLTAPDFQVFEDGRKVPTGSIVVEPENSAPVGLVLAVDVSTEPADLAEIRSGLRTIVEQMRPQDEAALLSFHDTVQVEQSATSDRALLLAAIDQLQVQGNFTSLNRATVEAMNRAELLRPTRRAVLIVTDSVENINSLPVDDVYSRADQVTIPIYLVAFSPKSQPASAMEAFGQRIKATPSVVDTAIAARLRMIALTSLFSQSYQLRFLSSLPADAEDHSLSISLADGDGLARSAVAFTAQPSLVQVALPGFSDGMRTGGLLTLTPEISAPGPVRSVTYLVDGQVVATFTEPPFSFMWDATTVSEGSHVLNVRAEDSASNSGELFVTLQIVDPLVIQAQTSQDRLYAGDEITVLTEIDALRPLTSVEFQVNGVRLAQRTEPPYIFSFPSAGYDPGTHIVTVRAVDGSGYAESTRFALALQPPPPGFLFTQRTWLRILAVAAIGLALLLAYLLLGYLTGLATRRRRRGFALKLENLGNTLSAFLVRLDDPSGRLQFRLMQQGLRLSGRTVSEWRPLPREEVENRVAAATASAYAPPAGIGGAPASGPYPLQPVYAAPAQAGPAQPIQAEAGPEQAAGSGLQNRLSGLQGNQKKVSGFKRATQAVSGLFQAAAVLLPASLGGRFVQQGARGFGQAAQQASRVENVQRQAAGVGELGGRGQVPMTRAQMRDQGMAPASPAAPSGGLGKAVQQGQQAAGGSTALAVPQTVTATPANGAAYAPSAYSPPGSDAGANGYGGANGVGYAPAGAAHSPAEVLPDLRFDEQGQAYEEETLRIVDEWIETAPVGPGDALHLELLVEPKKTHKRRQVPFRISTKAVEGGEHTLQMQEQTVEIQGITWTERVLLPGLVLLLAGLLCGLMILFLLADFGLIGPLSPQDILESVRSLVRAPLGN